MPGGEAYQRIVDEVNETLAPYERMKRMTVVAEEWSRGGRGADAEHEAEAAGGGEEVRDGDWRVLCGRGYGDEGVRLE